MRLQQEVFGNPARIISDRGAAFASAAFDGYCKEQGIEHIMITTGVPRGNGQVERIQGTVIPVLSKLSKEDPSKWYKYVSAVQRILNSTTTRSTKYTPFELMVGVRMRNKNDIRIKELLDEEYRNNVMQSRGDIREEARKNILRIQQENCRQFNRKRRKPTIYRINDLVAIQRTQFGAGLKLRPKFLGPYRIKAIKSNDRYDVERLGSHEGPKSTSTAADYMKPWTTDVGI